MPDVNDDAKAGFRHIEVLTGPGRRQRWSAAEKAGIVAETIGAWRARVGDCTRWQVCPQRVFGWRRQARLDMSEINGGAGTVFVAAVRATCGGSGADCERCCSLADADRTNQTLAAFFCELVTSPPNAADDDMRPWLDGLLETAIRERWSLVIDLGGGDQLLKRVALELGLAEFLVRNGVTPAVLYFVGTDRDDIAYLRETEHNGLLAPERTAIVFNAGVVPAGVSLDAAWTKHENDPALVGSSQESETAVFVRLVCLSCRACG